MLENSFQTERNICAPKSIIYFLLRATNIPTTPIANKANVSGSGTVIILSANADADAIDKIKKETNLFITFT